MSLSRASQSFVRLLEIMALLRSPAGCPWDAEQTPESLRSYLIEEAHEVLEAIDSGETVAIREELGDLLLQIVFQSRIFEERGCFDVADVCDGISDKLVRRHPHVFAGQTARDAKALADQWERIKTEEKTARGPFGALAGVPGSLPALRKARKISDKAARVGFDWPDMAGIRDKVREEFAELEEALEAQDRSAIEDELGDLLFTLVNLGRFLAMDAEDSLNRAISRFQKRFSHMEEALTCQGRSLSVCAPDEMDVLWHSAKEAEKDEK
jgi:MazG family protein